MRASLIIACFGLLMVAVISMTSHAHAQEAEALLSDESDAEIAALPDALSPAEEMPGTGGKMKGNKLFPQNSWNTSIMFNISDMRKLKEVFEAIERRRREGGATDVAGTPGGRGEAGGESGSNGWDSGNQPADGETDIAALDQPGDGSSRTGDAFVDNLIHGIDGIDQQAEANRRKPRDAPSLYLNSVMYKSPREWTIWVNGQRYTRKQPPENYRIVRVDEKKVEFMWQTDDLDFVSPGWRMAGIRAENIRIDEASGEVFFTLYPNQSFVARAMEVIEGKAMSYTLQAAAPALDELPQELESGSDETETAPEDAEIEAEAEAAPPSSEAEDRKKFEDALDAARRAVEQYQDTPDPNVEVVN